MAKKKLTLGMAAAAVAGTAVYVAKKSQDKKNQNGTSQNVTWSRLWCQRGLFFLFYQRLLPPFVSFFGVQLFAGLYDRALFRVA